VPSPGFRVGARRAVSPRAIHVLIPDLGTMDNLMLIPQVRAPQSESICNAPTDGASTA